MTLVGLGWEELGIRAIPGPVASLATPKAPVGILSLTPATTRGSGVRSVRGGVGPCEDVAAIAFVELPAGIPFRPGRLDVEDGTAVPARHRGGGGGVVVVVVVVVVVRRRRTVIVVVVIRRG